MNKKKMQKGWFGEWFNSSYYHMLYKNRDYKEAGSFIDNLIEKLRLDSKHKVLDLACGKGRHSIYLNQKGFDVIGVDLSAKNIEAAKESENERLLFFIHDMRAVFRENHFDFIFNLFTSFGYFDDDAENYQSVKAMETSLKPGGILTLDFLNPHKVIANLIPEEIKLVNGVEFHIVKTFKDGFILKDIRFQDQGREFHYQEKVRALTQKDFLSYFEAADLKVSDCFGDYGLNPYESDNSDRMIFIAQKKKP